MSFFSKILDRLGLGSANAAESPNSTTMHTPGGSPAGSVASTPTGASGGAGATGVGATGGTATPAGAGAPGAGAIPVSDVVTQLDRKAADNPQKLNWRTSIVDLLKLLDIDSSLAARKELATELGCPPDLMTDSAKMNVWLHKKVLGRIAANGGNVPGDLID